jgi:uncharacterized protein YjbI with pentapeptide repeats
MVRWFVRFAGSVALVAGMLAVPVVLSTTAPASADTVVDGCTVVSNPTSTHFTNCPGVDFSGTDFSGTDLSYANLAHANLTGVTLADCFAGPPPTCVSTDLNNANLTDANLTGIVTANSVGTRCGAFPCTASGIATFRGANLSGANMSDNTYGGVDFSGANLTDANLAGSTMDQANSFIGPVTIGATLTGANFTGTIAVPSNQSATATSQAGAAVTWSAPVGIAGATLGSCTPASGSTFPLFSSTVTCQVLDANGDVATGTFQVNVAPTTQYFTRMLIPSDGTIVQGAQVLDATAADGPGITSVAFELSGGGLSSPVVVATATPTLFGWLANWNPLNCGSGGCVGNGTYDLQSVATDKASNTDTSTPVSITLNIQAPTTAMVSPADGSNVSGAAVSVTASASTPAGVKQVGFEITSQTCGTFCFNNHLIGSENFGAGNTTVTGAISWDSYGYPNGNYTLDSFVIDQLNQENVSAPITVTVDNPPPVTLIPSNGATQSGTAALLDAVASGPLIAPWVTFEISGGTLNDYQIAMGKATLYGWLATWDTTAVPNGTYTLNSVATYLSGATGAVPLNDTSAPITITVNNPPPTTRVGLPANGATVSGSQFLDASASSGVTKVQYELSGGPSNLVDQIISGSTLTAYGWLGGWNTASVPNGTYTLNSVASYAGGVTGTSPPITFTVAN